MGLGVLTGQIRADLVDQVLADTGRVQRRRRRFAGPRGGAVVPRVDPLPGPGLPQGGAGPGPQSGGRPADTLDTRLVAGPPPVGPAPLAALFARLRGPQAVRPPRARWARSWA